MIREGQFYARNPDAVAVGRGDTFLFCCAGARRVFSPVDAGSMSRLLQLLMGPVDGKHVLAAVGDDASGLREQLEALLEAEMLLESASADALIRRRTEMFTRNRGYHFEPAPRRCERLVMGMGGSIGAGLMAPFVLSLCYSGFHKELDLIFTPSALRFVQPELYEYYGIRTWTDAFQRRGAVTVPHITLGKSADLVLVMPASARTIARLAEGSCSDLLSLTCTVTRAPVVVAAAMNTSMWNHPAVARNVAQIRRDGAYVVEPTLFFEAAELTRQSGEMYGAPGMFWLGPGGLMEMLDAVLALHAGRLVTAT